MAEITQYKKPVFSKSAKGWLIGVSVLGLVFAGGTIIYGLRITSNPSPKNSPTEVKTPQLDAITALGRLEPKGEVIKVAPAPNLGGAKVAKLLVEEGDFLKKGQMIAILDNFDKEQAKVNLARQELKVAQANLEIVKAGAKKGEIAAQTAEIQRLKAELSGEIATNQVTIARLQAQLQGETTEQNATIQRLKAELADAQRDYQRYQVLAEDGVISNYDLEQRLLKLDTAREKVTEAQARLNKTIETLSKQIREEKSISQQKINTLKKQIQEATATLDKIAEVRTVDVEKAQAEVEKAQATLKQSQADLALAYVKSPIDGQILKIHARPGEQVQQADGIAEMGNTKQMMVIAEVYESDINKIRLGQKAIITSENGTFKEAISGKVEQIGLKVGKKDVLDTDPAADIDARVIEVKILLDSESSDKVSGLTYAKVIAEILLN